MTLHGTAASENPKADAKDIEKLGHLIQGIKVAMLTTVGSDGTLHGRPMATQDRLFDGTLWFFTQLHSQKMDEIDQRDQVNLSYARPDKEQYVSISGTAQLVRDTALIREFWNPLLKAWFPKGLDDPELALLRVDVERAEYWDASSSTVVTLVGFVRAIVTGQPYRPGENKKFTTV